MKKIFKYRIEVKDEQVISIPKNSRILSVEEQFGQIVIYAVINTTEERTENYSIIIHGTGHPANDIDDCNFLDTVKLENGALMFHVFYKIT